MRGVSDSSSFPRLSAFLVLEVQVDGTGTVQMIESALDTHSCTIEEAAQQLRLSTSRLALSTRSLMPHHMGAVVSLSDLSPEPQQYLAGQVIMAANLLVGDGPLPVVYPTQPVCLGMTENAEEAVALYGKTIQKLLARGADIQDLADNLFVHLEAEAVRLNTQDDKALVVAWEGEAGMRGVVLAATGAYLRHQMSGGNRDAVLLGLALQGEAGLFVMDDATDEAAFPQPSQPARLGFQAKARPAVAGDMKGFGLDEDSLRVMLKELREEARDGHRLDLGQVTRGIAPLSLAEATL